MALRVIELADTPGYPHNVDHLADGYRFIVMFYELLICFFYDMYLFTYARLEFCWLFLITTENNFFAMNLFLVGKSKFFKFYLL